jgi:hypothetical protein
LNQQQNLAKVSSLCNDLLLKKFFSKSPCWIFFCFLNMHFFNWLKQGGQRHSDPPVRVANPESIPQPPCSGASPESTPQTPLFGGLAPNPASRPPCSGGQPRIHPPDPPCSGGQPRIQPPDPLVRGASPESSLQPPSVRGASPESTLQTPPCSGASPGSSLKSSSQTWPPSRFWDKKMRFEICKLSCKFGCLCILLFT